MAYELWEEQLVRDRGSWIDMTVQNCEENVPRGPRRIIGEVIERTPDEASVRVHVIWDDGRRRGGPSAADPHRPGWRIAGYAARR